MEGSAGGREVVKQPSGELLWDTGAHPVLGPPSGVKTIAAAFFSLCYTPGLIHMEDTRNDNVTYWIYGNTHGAPPKSSSDSIDE